MLEPSKAAGLVGAVWLAASACGPREREEASAADPVSPKEVEVWSGQSKGGSDVVVCREAYATMGYRLTAALNLFEARTRWATGVDLGGDELSVDAKVRLLLDRIATHDSARGEKYQGWFETFWSEADLLPAHRLPNVADEGQVSLAGPDCDLQQVALRQDPLPADGKRYVISKVLWDQLDRNSQAATVLNELIFRDAQETGEAVKSEESRRYGATAIGNRFTAFKETP